MPDKDAFSDLRIAKEEEFFHSREQALLEKVKQRAAAQSEARRLGEVLGTRDEGILQDLQALGYTTDIIQILFAVPLIAVAWADGEVSKRERSLIQELAGVSQSDNAAAHHQLKQWLDKKPPQDFLERSLRIISSLLKTLPPDEESDRGRELLTSATRIAEASGGFLGLGSISATERALIERVAREIENAHAEAARNIAQRL
jgi:tellurite resistance protein